MWDSEETRHYQSERSGRTPEIDAFFRSIPVEGSLGLLALGAVGVIAWRKKREALKKREDFPGAAEGGNG